MQISKALLIIWAGLLSFVSLSLQAADNDAQSKAREALRKKMDELQPGSGETAAPAQAPAPAAQQATQPVTPVKPPKRAARPMPAPAVVTPAAAPEVVATPPADSEAVAKAREALRKKMDELQGQPVPETPTVTAPPPVAVKPRRPARVTAPPEMQRTPAAPIAPPTFAPAPVPRAPTPAPVAVPETPTPAPVVAQPQVPSAPQPSAVSPSPSPQPAVVTSGQNNAVPERWEAEQAAQKQAAMKQKPGKGTKVSAPAFRPIEGPPLGISAEKQQRLSELLRRYQVDEITPSQYHEERAKILTQP